MKYLYTFLFPVLLLLFFTACDNSTSSIDERDDEQQAELNVPEGFDFSTTREVELRIEARLTNGTPLSGVRYDVFDNDPFDEDSRRLGSFFLDESGTLQMSMELPAYLTHIYVGSYFPAAGHFRAVNIEDGFADVLIDPADKMTYGGKKAAVTNKNGDWNTLGDWSPENGRPEYLTVPDVLEMSFLTRIGNTLPESFNIPNNNPEYIENNIPRDLYIEEDGQVWITFIGSGAGWRNAMGYYYYEEGNKPQTPADIENKTMVFPYAHTKDDALYPGAKVQLQGPMDQGAFPGGTKIGWFLVSDGWNPEEGDVDDGKWTLYADQDLNTLVPDPDLRQHTVMIYDTAEQKLVIGWEDWKRDQTQSDQDFNDVIFYTSWNPLESVDTDPYPELGDPDDDPRIIENYSPSEDSFGTLAFEDLWPSFGDYDMNDLVLDYQIKETANANNNIEEIEFTLVIRATGASFNNGFGFELNTPASNVSSVTGNRLSTGTISTNGNGSEAGQSKAVIIAFDDANDNFPRFGNVYADNAHSPEDTLTVTVSFDTPVPKQQLGSAPYNPFIILNQTRSREVHLPGKTPTDLADTSLFGTANDDSNENTNRFYLSQDNLNWAIHVPVSIPYALESVNKTEAYLKFQEWAESGGLVYPDWYLDESGYRNVNNLYTAP